MLELAQVRDVAGNLRDRAAELEARLATEEDFTLLAQKTIEEREVRARFGAAYDVYAAQVPRFVPRPGVRYDGSAPPPEPPRAAPQPEVTYG